MQWALLLGGGLIALALVRKLSPKASEARAAATVASPQTSLAVAEAAYQLQPTGMQIAAPKVGALAGVAGTTAAEIAPHVATGTLLHGVLAAAGPIGAAAAAAAVLARFIFKGADPRQVPAAKIDQAYTTAGRNISALFRQAHMLTKQAALDGINALMQGAIQAEQDELDALAKGKPLNAPLKNAIPHIKESFQAQLNGVNQVPDTPTTQPVNLVKARTYYQQWQKGYYRDCIAWAAQLTDAFVSKLPQGEYLK